MHSAFAENTLGVLLDGPWTDAQNEGNVGRRFSFAQAAGDFLFSSTEGVAQDTLNGRCWYFPDAESSLG